MLRWRPWNGVDTDERLLDARGREVLCVGELACEFVDVDERGRSTDALGVEASENTRDFRLAGGKKPSSLRGIRPICVGFLSFGRRTQESCFQGGSESALDVEGESVEDVSVSLGFDEDQPLGNALEPVSGLLLQSPSRRSSSC